MEYEFQKLSEVEALAEMPEEVRVLAEVGGDVKRVPFQKLSEVEELTEVPEGASVLAEVNGSIKRVPGSGLGGGKTLIIIGPDFKFAQTMTDPSDNSAWDEFENSFDTEEEYFSAFSTNITFDEAISAFRKGELTGAFLYTTTTLYNPNDNDNVYITAVSSLMKIADLSIMCTSDCLSISPVTDGIVSCTWTSDGFVSEPPFKNNSPSVK